MLKKLTIVLLISTIVFSCNKKDEEPKLVNFAIFFETVCIESFSIICVSEIEFKRIQEVFKGYEDDPDLDCLAITVKDLDGIYRVFLKRRIQTLN
ncbi:hypothetical protein CSC80_10595 [Maribacter sp. 6B07]|nr:hypothetical protein CSC80_10595 [Maribacter sp. 6B07]